MNYGMYRRKSDVSVFLSTEWLIATIFMLQILNGYLSELLSLWNVESITSIVYLVIVALSFFAYFKAFVNRPVLVVLACVIAVAVIGLSCVLDPAVSEYVFDFGSGSFGEIGNSELFIFTGLCFPTFLLCLMEVDTDLLYRLLYKYSVVAAIMFIVLMGLHIFRFATKLNYMSVAYNVMLPLMVLYFASREKRNHLATVLWIGILVGFLAGGCRGAVLTGVVLIALWEFKKLMPLNVKKFLGLFALIIVAVIIILNFQQILLEIDVFFETKGYTSRLLEKYFGRSADGDLLHISDRLKLYTNILNDLTLSGHGVFADRLVLKGQYAHNFVFEIIYQFGYLIGIPVLLAFISLLFCAGARAKRSGDPFKVFICFSYVVYLCTKMMVSASYITDRMFWLYFGLCFVLCRHRNAN